MDWNTPGKIQILISLLLSALISNSLTPAYVFMIRKYVFGEGMSQNFLESVLFFSTSISLPIIIIVSVIYGSIFIELANRYNWRHISTYAMAGLLPFVIFTLGNYSKYHPERSIADNLSLIFLCAFLGFLPRILQNQKIQMLLILITPLAIFLSASFFINRGGYLTMTALYGMFSASFTWIFCNYSTNKTKLEEDE